MDCDFFTALYEVPTTSQVVGKNGVAPCPYDPSMSPFSSMWTWALGMSSRATDKNAAWYFIQWATAKQQMQQATLSGGNYNPTRASGFNRSERPAEDVGLGQRHLPSAVLDNLNKYATLGWPPEPVQTFVGTRWDQALQEICSGNDSQQSLDSAKQDIDDHMKDVGLLS